MRRRGDKKTIQQTPKEKKKNHLFPNLSVGPHRREKRSSGHRVVEGNLWALYWDALSGIPPDDHQRAFNQRLPIRTRLSLRGSRGDNMDKKYSTFRRISCWYLVVCLSVCRASRKEFPNKRTFSIRRGSWTFLGQLLGPITFHMRAEAAPNQWDGVPGGRLIDSTASFNDTRGAADALL